MTHDVAQGMPRPMDRGRSRLILGSFYFSCRRYAQWYVSGRRYAKKRIGRDKAEQVYPMIAASHQSPLLRDLDGAHDWMQHNKVRNLKLATAQLDGCVLRPGETLSVWRLVGRPSSGKGYVPGMVLVNGTVQAGVGGGLCQMSNLMYWMTLHTELTVVERFRHQYDVFPDSNRTVPFGSGATISYNYIDLQIRNDTRHDYCLCLDVTSTHLAGAWRSTEPSPYRYEIVERNHHITQHSSGKYIRHNEIWRRKYVAEFVGEERIAENHALMMYSPLLAEPLTQ